MSPELRPRRAPNGGQPAHFRIPPRTARFPEDGVKDAWRGGLPEDVSELMRRGIAWAAWLLVLAGLEMSTEALTLVVHRLDTGFSSILAGVDFQVPAVRFLIGVAGIVFGVGLGILLAWSARKRKAIGSVGDACPLCGNETKRIKRMEWQRILSVLLGERLTRRKCDTCGWMGLTLKQ